jgi:hypothetical protein
VPTYPEQINFTQETLGLRRAGFSPALSLLMLTESFLIAPTALSVPLRSYRMLAYHRSLATSIRSFGAWFEPRCIVGAGLLDQ